MAKVQCQNCGNTIFTTDKQCPYCFTKDPFVKEGLTENPVDKKVSKEVEEWNEGNQIDVVVLILLVLFFWPGAIIYVVVKQMKQKDLRTKLLEIKHLLDEGLITQEEYNQRRENLINVDNL